MPMSMRDITSPEKVRKEGFDCLKSILKDRECLVVHPRRIILLFKRVHAKSRVAFIQSHKCLSMFDYVTCNYKKE